jgi:hypothetical protein
MRLFRRWTAWFRRVLRAASIALDPGEGDDAPPPNSSRVMLTHDDLLWFKTSQDEEGRITFGLLERFPHGLGVLVDDNGESLGLWLSRAEAQDLHRSLLTWLANTARTVSS